MKRFPVLVGLFLMLVADCAAAVQFAWTDINFPVEGRRYVYAGTMTDTQFGSSSTVDVTREYSNVQATATGVRFDVTTTVRRHADASLVLDYTESRELNAANEILLRRDAHGLTGMNDFDSLTFVGALVAPRSFEIGQTYSYSNLFTGPTPTSSGREQRVVRALLIEMVAMGGDSVQAAKISTGVSAATGTLIPSYGETDWYARNVGPVRLQISTALHTVIDVSLASANFALAPLGFDGAGPQIIGDPESTTVAAGTTARFRVLATGADSTYAWTKDGVTVPGATAATLVLPAVTAANSGLYRATVNTSGVAVQSKSARLSVTSSSPGQVGRLANLSVRAFAGDGAAQLIAGLSIQGTQAPHRMLLRGIGRGLASFTGGHTALAPSLTVRAQNGAVLAENADWGNSPGSAALVQMAMSLGAFALDPALKDAALIMPLSDGNYTALERDLTGGTGLVECYDADADLPGGFANLSARADVRGEPLIAGIAVMGGPMKLLVRAVGPSLDLFGVPNTYANPTLRLVDSQGVDVATNDDWSTSAQKDELQAAFAATGAFPLKENSRDAALIVTVAPSGYTAVVDTSAFGGNVLIEVYRLPN